MPATETVPIIEVESASRPVHDEQPQLPPTSNQGEQTSALARRDAVPGLLKVEEARQLLAECVRVDDAKQIRDQAAAIRVYLRQQNASREAQNDAAEIKLRAERRLGELLEPDREKRGTVNGLHVRSLPEGVSHKQSFRWQEMARIPDKKFERYVREQRESPVGEITTAGLTRAAARVDDDDETSAPDPRIEKIVSTAIPSVVDAVRKGVLTLAEADAIADLPPEEQRSEFSDILRTKMPDEQVRRGIEKIESAIETLKQGHELVKESFLQLGDLDRELTGKVGKALGALTGALNLAAKRKWQISESEFRNSAPPSAAPEQPAEPQPAPPPMVQEPGKRS